MGKVIPLNARHAALTVTQAVEAFLGREWSDNTRRNFASDLKRFCEAFGRRRVGRVDAADIKAYLDGLKTRRDGEEQPVSPSTFNRHFGTLRNLFGWLERQEELGRSPMGRVERRKVGERLPRPMTPKQIERFFTRIESVRDRALFSLLHRSGLRIAEALSLDIEDLNMGDGTFRVVGKGDRERVGYVAEETQKFIKRYLRDRGETFGPLFTSRQGRLSYAMARRLFDGYADGLAKKKLTIHQLRHTFGSERAGQMDALVLRDLMGHRSLKTTQQYAQVNGDSVKKAFRAFDRGR